MTLRRKYLWAPSIASKSTSHATSLHSTSLHAARLHLSLSSLRYVAGHAGSVLLVASVTLLASLLTLLAVTSLVTGCGVGAGVGAAGLCTVLKLVACKQTNQVPTIS